MKLTVRKQKKRSKCEYCCDYCCTKGGCILLWTSCCFGCKKLCNKWGCCSCCCNDPQLNTLNNDDTAQQKKPLSTELKISEKNELISDSEKAETKISQIILMGDSVLDDFYWLENKTLDIRQQIANEYS